MRVSICLLASNTIFVKLMAFVVYFQATATQKVQNDLMEMLHIPRCVKFVSTVNRPNLFYMVCLLVHSFWLCIFKSCGHNSLCCRYEKSLQLAKLWLMKSLNSFETLIQIKNLASFIASLEKNVNRSVFSVYFLLLTPFHKLFVCSFNAACSDQEAFGYS